VSKIVHGFKSIPPSLPLTKGERDVVIPAKRAGIQVVGWRVNKPTLSHNTPISSKSLQNTFDKTTNRVYDVPIQLLGFFTAHLEEDVI